MNYRKDIHPYLNAEVVYGSHPWRKRQASHWGWHSRLCPACGESKAASAPRFRVCPESLGYKCHRCGVSGDPPAWLILTGQADALRHAMHILAKRVGAPATPPAAIRPYDDTKRLQTARRFWRRAMPIPMDADHPARRWASASGDKPGVWPANKTWPVSVRWLPVQPWQLDKGHQGTGSLVAAFMPFDAWRRPDWETQVAAVQLLGLTTNGRQCDLEMDSGSKRSYGLLKGAVCLVRTFVTDAAESPLGVTEGVADTLAVATWFGQNCVALGGTGGFHIRDTWPGDTGLRTITVYDDADPAGGRAANILKRALGDKVGFWTAPFRGTDPAEVAAVALAQQEGRDDIALQEQLARVWLDKDAPGLDDDDLEFPFGDALRGTNR